MQYIMYIKMAIELMTFFKQFKDARATGSDLDFELVTGFLGRVGEVADIKELKPGGEISLIMPEIKGLIDAAKALKD